MVVISASVALSTGACAPRAKPLGYLGGAALSIAGTVMMADAAATDCTPEDPFTGLFVTPVCATASAAGTLFGAVTLLTGVGILVAAMASPAESAPAGALPAALPAALPSAPGLPGGFPEGPRLPPPPARSPSAPSGSPLAFD